MRHLSFFLIILFLVACGYKPASHQAREILGERIYVDVTISRQDPRNSVLIKDAVNESVITRLGGRLSSKEMANSELLVKIGTTTFTPILYNRDGFVTAYKAKVSLNIKYATIDGKSGSFSPTGEHDFPVAENPDGTTNSVISDAKRFEAIKLASLDALNEFVSSLALRGIKN